MKAIRQASITIQNNSSGPRLEKALENREMNRNWFFRNVDKLERKLSSQEFNQFKIDLNIE